MNRHRVEDMVFHGLAIDWKFYYRARCSGCGWVAKSYRGTEEKAEADHMAHVIDVDHTEDGP